MAPADDRRVIRTKAAIRSAMISLIEEKGFEALSVKDITDKANINRSTFYLHYVDKFDLFDQTLEGITQDLHRILTEIITLTPDDLQDIKMPYAVVVKVFEYFLANAALMKTVLGTKGNIALQNKMKKIMWSALFEKNFSPLIKKENLVVPFEYFASYIAAAHFGVIQQWLENGCRETPEEMARILTNLTFRGPLFAAGVFH
ncbi:TetR/AcrR family transcriptional regulator [Desulfitobacterium sp. THU1]|uniref:TetR/AcrR family transcriptional regulator n=1 Tax=Desulfitobacterium sp. THU1 TaxID=3138072 RepID=UPI00311E3F9A